MPQSNFRTILWGHTATESAGSANVPVVDTLPLTGAPPNDGDTLVSYIDALTLATIGKSEKIDRAPHASGSKVRPVNPEAQKEKRWRVSYTDNVNGKQYSFEIPGADLSLLSGNTEFVDLTAGAGLNLKTFLDANGRSELDNAITVNAIKFVTR